MYRRSYNRIIVCFFVTVVFMALNGCATPLPPKSEYLNFTVGVTGVGKTAPDLESAYAFVSNIKGPDNILIVYDASGSMRWPTVPGGEPRYKQAHKSLARYLEGIRLSDNVGLIVYGSRHPSGAFGGKIQNHALAKKSCEDIEVTIPFGKFSKGAFSSELDRLSQSKSYRGDTPIGGAILKATSMFKGVTAERKHIILITDGAEECFNEKARLNIPGSVSPENAVKKATDEGITVSIVAYGIGLGKDGRVVTETKQALNSLRNLATGVFVVANTGESLTRALMQVEVENFKLDLFDENMHTVASKFTIGQTVRLDIGKYKDQARVSRVSESGSEQSPRMKFIISPVAKRDFKKGISIHVDAKEARVFLGLKSPTDQDPDILPAYMRW